ncbi:MAG TPA: protein-disulfide reductase DsbD domain-containing protein [Thermoanaerobaculia bacterium]|nr:protein-disulfide reductase DsbD domain-containing protein [Thermoanaerobaculia bacterium]
MPARRLLLQPLAAASLLGLLLSNPPAARAEASRWTSNEQSSVRLITAYRVAPRSGSLRLGIHFRLAPGWHVYWKNSGDAGFAPQVTFASEPRLERPELLWPAPHRYELPGGLVAFGYSDEVVYPVQAVLATQGAASGSRRDRDFLPLAADVDYLVCKIDCVPYRYTVSLAQPLGDQAAADPATAPLLERWRRQVPPAAEMVPGVATAGRIEVSPAGGLQLVVQVDGAGAGPGGPDLFFESHPALETGRPLVASGSSGRAGAGGEAPIVFAVPLQPRDVTKPLPPRTTFAWTVTGLQRNGAPLALSAQREVALAASARTARARPAAASAGQPTPAPLTRRAWREWEPLGTALVASMGALLALWSWGLLGVRRAPRAAGFIWREALGFATLAGVLWPLYRMSFLVAPEELAGIELALLCAALLAWLRSRASRRGALRLALALGLLACAAAPLWLASHRRLPRAEISAATAGRGTDHQRDHQDDDRRF